jgi:hypothetical protein
MNQHLESYVAFWDSSNLPSYLVGCKVIRDMNYESIDSDCRHIFIYAEISRRGTRDLGLCWELILELRGLSKLRIPITVLSRRPKMAIERSSEWQAIQSCPGVDFTQFGYAGEGLPLDMYHDSISEIDRQAFVIRNPSQRYLFNKCIDQFCEENSDVLRRLGECKEKIMSNSRQDFHSAVEGIFEQAEQMYDGFQSYSTMGEWENWGILDGIAKFIKEAIKAELFNRLFSLQDE